MVYSLNKITQSNNFLKLSDKICYLEIFDDGDTIGVIYDVPVSILKKVED